MNASIITREIYHVTVGKDQLKTIKSFSKLSFERICKN